MRLFVAAVPGEELLAALVQAQEDLRRLGGRGNFSARENLHLTLAFLGETDRPDGARRALSRLTGSPLALWAEGLGRFRRPEGDLCWAGIRPSPPLEAVARRLAGLLGEEGFSLEERPFRPHLTLARRLSLPGGWTPGLEVLLPPTPWRVERLDLMESTRREGRLQYRSLQSFPLAEG